MTPAGKSEIRWAAAWPPCLLLVVFASRPANSQSFDCQKAATAIERTICTDGTLKQLDSELARNYRAAVRRIVPEGSKALVATQRAWVSDRDRQCASGASECLAEKYRERNDLLLALLACTSEENPLIDAADPAVLLGTWVVAPESGGPASSDNLTPIVEHLPPPGARLVAKVGEFCVVEPPEAKICSQFGLAVEQHPALAATAHSEERLPEGSTVLLAYFDGRAAFDLIVGPNEKVAAEFLECDAAGNNCRRVSQPWLPASPDATVKIYHLFD